MNESEYTLSSLYERERDTKDMVVQIHAKLLFEDDWNRASELKHEMEALKDELKTIQTRIRNAVRSSQRGLWG